MTQWEILPDNGLQSVSGMINIVGFLSRPLHAQHYNHPMDSCLILIPCHNCRKRLGQVLLECRSLDLDLDIMVVDDGSRDGSMLIPEMQHVRFAIVQEHKGVGHALQNGFRMAREKGYRTVITLDADGAHDPKDIPGMIECKMKNDVVMVIGNRWHGGRLSGLPGCKVSANRFAATLVGIAGGVSLPDVACGLRAIDVSMTGCLGETAGFGFMYEMIFSASKKGAIGSYPVNVRYDASDLWFTKKRELLDLIGACENRCIEVSVLSELRKLCDLVMRFECFAVRFLLEGEIRGMYFVHPLVAYDGFVFQEQHASFFEGFENMVCFE